MNWLTADLPRFSECTRRTSAPFDGFSDTWIDEHALIWFAGMPVDIGKVELPIDATHDGEDVIPVGRATVTPYDGAPVTVPIIWQTGKAAHEWGLYGQQAALADCIADYCDRNLDRIAEWARTVHDPDDGGDARYNDWSGK